MEEPSEAMCDFCKDGYHAPFERFEKMAVTPDGPAFLMRCNICGTLWYETLHSARRVERSEALKMYPEIEL